MFICVYKYVWMFVNFYGCLWYLWMYMCVYECLCGYEFPYVCEYLCAY